MKKVSALLALLAAALTPCSAQIEDEKPQFDKSKAELAALPLPNPSDKLIAIEEVVGADKIDWKSVADNVAMDIDANDFTEQTDAALALGVKIADGILAIRAQDVEKLNRSADQLEGLGKNLGATAADLTRARQVRDLANRGEWLSVYLELGRLQADIMKKLNTEENQNDRTLVIASGWLQGARYATSLIIANYTPDLSNILREPVLAAELSKQLAALPASMQDSDKVRQVRNAVDQMAKIVDVPLNAPIEKNKVEQIKSLADTAVQAVTSN